MLYWSKVLVWLQQCIATMTFERKDRQANQDTLSLVELFSLHFHLLASIYKNVTFSIWSSMTNENASVKPPILAPRFNSFPAHLQQRQDHSLSIMIPSFNEQNMFDCWCKCARRSYWAFLQWISQAAHTRNTFTSSSPHEDYFRLLIR